MSKLNQQTSTNPPAPVNGGIEEEKVELLNQCYQLLKKIANRPFGIKLLLSAVHALETIAGYKNRVDKRRTHQESSTKLLTIPPKKNE
jgi:hypothetical protein